MDKLKILKEIVDDDLYKEECINELIKSLSSFDNSTESLIEKSHFQMVDITLFNKILALFTTYKLNQKKLSKELAIKEHEIEKQANMLESKSFVINSLHAKSIDVKNSHLIELKKRDTATDSLKIELSNLKLKYDQIRKKNRSLNNKEELLIKHNGLQEKTIYKLKTLKFNNKNKANKRGVGCEGFTIISLNEDEPLYIKDRIADNSLTINNLDNEDFLNEEKIPIKKRKTESRHLNLRLETEDTNSSVILNSKEGIDVYQIVNNYEEEIRIYKDSINDIKERFELIVTELNLLFKEFSNRSESTNKIMADFESYIFDINRINLDVFEQKLKQHVIKYKSIVNSYGNYKKDRLEKVEDNYKYLVDICRALIGAIYKTSIDKSLTGYEFVKKELNLINEKDAKIKEIQEWIENQYERE